MIVTLSVLDMDRHGLPLALDSFSPEEIMDFVIRAKSQRAEWARDVAAGIRPRNTPLDSVHYTVTYDDGRYYAVSAQFL